MSVDTLTDEWIEKSATEPVRKVLDQINFINKKIYQLAELKRMAFILGVFIIFQTVSPKWLPLIILIPTTTFVFAIFFSELLKFMQKSKTIFIEEFCKITGFSYHPNGDFSVDDAKRHKIFPQVVGFPQNGLSGTYKHASFSVQEILYSKDGKVPKLKSWPLGRYLSDRYGIDLSYIHSTHDEIPQRWVFILIRLDKKFYAHTIIKPNKIINLPFTSKSDGMSKVNIVSAEFEKRFDVYSTDQVEAREILDPAFIERLMDSIKVINPSSKDPIESLTTRQAETSFLDNEILFIYPSRKRLFSPIFPLLNRTITYEILSEFNRILRMIETLQLNPYTGLGAIRSQRI